MSLNSPDSQINLFSPFSSDTDEKWPRDIKMKDPPDISSCQPVPIAIVGIGKSGRRLNEKH